jgi:hypothetical protein
VKSPHWRFDGGSLFSKSVDGRQAAYTGKLDSTAADKYSERYTHSNKVRFWTKAGSYENVRVQAGIKPMGWHLAAPSTWSGFKFYLRRQHPTADTSTHGFYTAEPNIKDGSIYIQKKCRGSLAGGTAQANGGTYYLLAKKSPGTLPMNTWSKVAGEVKTNANGSVKISVYRNGVLQLTATDTGRGCAPHYGGPVGWRSDYFRYYADNFRVAGV